MSQVRILSFRPKKHRSPCGFCVFLLGVTIRFCSRSECRFAFTARSSESLLSRRRASESSPWRIPCHSRSPCGFCVFLIGVSIRFCFAQAKVGSHSPLVVLKACFQGGERVNLRLGEYPVIPEALAVSVFYDRSHLSYLPLIPAKEQPNTHQVFHSHIPQSSLSSCLRHHHDKRHQKHRSNACGP